MLKRPMSLIVFSSIISIGTLVAFNIPFFQYVIENSNESTIGIVWLKDIRTNTAGYTVDYQCHIAVFHPDI